MKRGRVAAIAVVALAIAAGRGLAVRRDPMVRVRAAMPTVVLVLAVDLDHGVLTARSSGSGTVIDPSGAILTNHHVLYDEERGRLHDLFVIGRFQREGQDPVLFCAGQPSAGVLDADLDLALIACDRNLDGQPLGEVEWPSAPIGQSESIQPGAQVWVLGYPAVGQVGIGMTAGLVSGWTGEHGGAGRRDYMRTDAAIGHGNSGGAAIDEGGLLVGVPTAFRVASTQRDDRRVDLGTVGLIRPIELARRLIALAQHGWRPVASGTSLPAEELAIDDGIPDTVRVSGHLISGDDHAPVSGAFVIVLPPGQAPDELDPSTLGDQALAWGETDRDGHFVVSPGIGRGRRYSVLLIAKGFRSQIARESLIVPTDAPPIFEPWPALVLQRGTEGEP